MDEIINISVNGNSLTKDSNCAGVQGEANSTKLRITFSENWDEYGKIITFWNALGENPVKVQLSTNLLENIVVNQRVYIVPIPGEAMTESGENTFVIHGIINNSVKRTVEGKLKVLASRQTDRATDPIDPTPTQAEQLRAEIDAVIDDIAEAAKAADAAVDARNSANEAEAAKEAVENMTVSAETLPGSTTATVEKTTVGTSVNLHFGIPKSESGVHIGASAPTNPDVNVWIDISGGADSIIPYIGTNGNWWIGTNDTGVKAEGKDGKDGAKGDKGDKGDTGAQGAKGADGNTPVRGVDYWTPSDKAEIVSAVIATLPKAEGASY